MRAIALRVAALLALAGVVAATASAAKPADKSVWNPDRGDGTYLNPVLFADYSDPDVVRAGDDFYLVASSFSSVPGLPLLHSRDLVNWTIVGHAAPRLPSPDFDTPQHGKGLWAPSLRHHGGRFWIYVGDPDRGIYVTTATDPRGPWAPLVLVKPVKGAIDPCPLWDDDGKMYLVHAWAKSRAGFNSVLTVTPLSADGRRTRGKDVQVFDGHARHPTIEGPKFHKRNGWYYIFAPAGGVATGWQTVLRAKSVFGPYEDRIVMRQGRTDVNGPHQGAWVETASGQSWFLHFQERGAYGRVVHLQPMEWKSDWPVIGADPDADGVGEPVPASPKPNVGAPIAGPQTSDEFDPGALGLQWQWNANPLPEWASLSQKAGWLRLRAAAPPQGVTSLFGLPNLLLQKLPAAAFMVTTRVDASALLSGESAGLVIAGRDTAALSVARQGSGLAIRTVLGKDVDQSGEDAAGPVTSMGTSLARASVSLRPARVPPGPPRRITATRTSTGFASSPFHEFHRTGVPLMPRIHHVFAALGLAAACAAAGQSATPPKAPKGASARPHYIEMADSVMARDPSPLTLDSAKPAWNYTQGLVLKGVLAVYEQTGDARYLDYVRRYYDYFINGDGSIKTYDINEYSVDRINAGKVLFPLYAKTKDEKYRKAIDLLRLQMKDHPRTKEGGFWHKKRYPWQMWLDGLYMASPFLAQYAVTFDEPKLIDDVIHQFVWMEAHARDPKTGLLYHGWDESREQKWADPKTGLSKEFWGRAVGWYAMALVDVLDFIPKTHPRRGEIVAILDRLAAAVVKVQDPKTGVFWQVLDKKGQDGNYLESSASVMFAYSFLKGARLGYLDPKYAAIGRAIYTGVIKEFVTIDEKGVMSIHKGCAVAGLGGDPNRGNWRSGTFDYYVKEPVRSNDPKAVGPFILASLEIDSGAR